MFTTHQRAHNSSRLPKESTSITIEFLSKRPIVGTKYSLGTSVVNLWTLIAEGKLLDYQQKVNFHCFMQKTDISVPYFRPASP